MAHQVRIGHCLTVVSEGDDASAGQLAGRRQQLARAVRADAAERQHPHRGRRLGLAEHGFDSSSTVDRRLGAGHRADGGEAAAGGGGGAAGDRLLVFGAGLAQVRLEIDEAGRDDEAGGVDPIGLDHHVALVRADARDPPVDDHDVGDTVLAERGIDDAAVVDREGAHDPASASVPPASTRPDSR